LPFQPAIGSHTSNFTAGLVTPATRQNAGRPLIACEPGGVNDGPPTSSADVICVSGKEIVARAAQDPSTAAAFIVADERLSAQAIKKARAEADPRCCFNPPSCHSRNAELQVGLVRGT